MDKWLSISQLSEVTGIPETTVRRYANKFDKYFRYEHRGRGKKYHPDSIEIIKRIAFLFSEDYEFIDIDSILSKEFSFIIKNEETTIQPRVKSLYKQFDEFNKEQEEFNNKLLKKIQEQQDYIQNYIDRRDEEYLNVLNQLQESKKQLAATKEKKWWQFWK